MIIDEPREFERVVRLMEQYGDRAVFVFGSNEAGFHGAGAARDALLKYGAKLGQAFGLQGQSYAIPTKNARLDSLSLHELRAYILDFLDDVKAEQPNVWKHEFVVTRIGCGLAKFADEDVAPLFRNAPDTCHLPIGWRAFNGEPEEA